MGVGSNVGVGVGAAVGFGVDEAVGVGAGSGVGVAFSAVVGSADGVDDADGVPASALASSRTCIERGASDVKGSAV